MSKRLQVLMDEEEYREIQGVARRQRLTASEWVRQALRKARQNDPESVEARLRIIAEASLRGAPTAEIDVMNDEIERGRLYGLECSQA
jgi:Arc/MetJ-type ribon-helix-helix transcriptional regulator